MRASTTAALLLFAAAALAQPDPESRSRNRPVGPFRIIGNVFYVGASDVASYLIATTEGHILIDGGFVETAPMIRANIEKVGCRLADVKILLNTHAHFDHAGGLAALKKQTGATLMASAGDAPLLERGGKNDPQFGNKLLFPAVKPDRILHDGEQITLGPSTLTAVMTPGHTPGCTTWTMTVRDKGRDYRVVIVGGSTIPDYKLVGNKAYLNIVNDYRHTFATLKSLPCDVFLGAHGSYFNLQGKLARKARGDTRNLFIDPNGYRQFVAAADRDFEKELKKQQAAGR